MKKVFILLFFLFPLTLLSQVVPLELENFDDIELLEEFDNLKEEPIVSSKEEPIQNDIDKALEDIDDQDTNTEENQDFKVDTVELKNEYFQEKNKEDNILYELNLNKERRVEELIKEKQFVTDNNKTKYSKLELFKLKVKLEDIIQSELVVVEVPRGSKLINLRNDDVEYLTQDLTARVYSKTDADKFLYIIDKKGALRYKVHHSLPARINRVTDLFKEPKSFQRLKKKKKITLYDKDFDYTLRLGIHTGVTNTHFTKKVISDTAQFATLFRSEVGAVSNINFPLQFGFSGYYEAITGDLTDDGKFSTKTFSAGPIIMKPKLLFNYDFIVQPRLSLSSRLNESRSDEIIIHKLNETSLLFSLEKVNKTKAFGNVVLGYNFQRKWIQPKAQSGALDVGTSSRFDDSIAIFIGHRSNWIW